MGFRPVTQLLFVGLFAWGAAACAPQHQVWFTPNIGSPDMLSLFTQPEQWELARSQTDVFKFYSEQLLSADCAPCGQNVLANLTQVQAIPKLQAWKVAVAAEVGVVKPDFCDGGAAAVLAEQLIGNVAALGGTVSYLAMDEPLASGSACDLTPAETAQQTSLFIQQIRQAYPGVVVGDIEPYPLFSVDDLTSWIGTLNANGTPPGFFHLDVDHRLTNSEGLDVTPDLKALQSYCQGQSLTFGVLLAGKDAVDDAGYYEDVVAWTQTVASAVGMPQHVVVQSFSKSTAGLFMVPTNLPEDDATLPTHTRLLNQTVEILKSQ